MYIRHQTKMLTTLLLGEHFQLMQNNDIIILNTFARPFKSCYTTDNTSYEFVKANNKNSMTL